MMFSAKEVSKINKYLSAAANLYGAIKIEDFLDVFHHYEKIPLTLENLKFFLSASTKAQHCPYFFKKDIITSRAFNISKKADNTFVNTIFKEGKNKPRYLPSKTEFLKYIDFDYVEPLNFLDDLRLYLFPEQNALEEAELNKKMLTLHNYIQYGMLIPLVLNYIIENCHKITDKDDANVLINLSHDLMNNTRLFTNNGYTPIELATLQPELKKNILFNFEPLTSIFQKKDTINKANLSKKDADHFYRLWYELLAYINNIYKICPTMQEYLENLEKSKIDDQLLFPIREKLWKKPYIIMNYCEANSTLNEEDINIYKSWLKHHLKSRFIIMDFQEEGSLFMPLNENVPTCIYQVLGINNDIRDLFKNKTLPFYIETVILPFKDVIIYDTYINIFQASFDEKTIDILYNQYENLLINNIKTNLN